MGLDNPEVKKESLTIILDETLNKGKHFSLKNVYEAVKEKDGKTPNAERCLAAIPFFINGLNFKGRLGDVSGKELASFIEENPDSVLSKFVSLGAIDTKEETPQEKIQEFYAKELEAIYKIVAKQKQGGERVKSKDIAEYLRSTRDPEKIALAELLEKEEAISKPKWLAFSTQKEVQYNQKETLSITAFSGSIDTKYPGLWNNITELVTQFQKDHPEYGHPTKTEYFIKKFTEIKKSREAEYNAAETRAIDTFLTNLPDNLWGDLDKAVAEFQKNNPRFTGPKQAEYFKRVMQERIDKYNAEETKAIDDYLNNLAVDDPLWSDPEKAAQAFHAANSKFAGKHKVDYFKERLEAAKLKNREAFNTAENKKLDAFFDTLSVEEQDQPNLVLQKFQALNPEYRDANKAQYVKNRLTEYRKSKEALFNAEENQAIDSFLSNAERSNLSLFDNPEQAANQYQSQTKFKGAAKAQYFKTKLEAKRKEVFKSQSESFASIANSLGDPEISAAMIASFEFVNSLEVRGNYLNGQGSESIKAKVAQYKPLIGKIKAQEPELLERSKAFPELAQMLTQESTQYQNGKKVYNSSFYSPRKYAEFLDQFQAQLTAKETLENQEKTQALSIISQKSLKDAPQIRLQNPTYEAFTGQLKKAGFYGLKKELYQDPEIRQAIASKNREIYQHWLSEQEKHIDKNKVQETNETKAAVSIVNRRTLKDIPDIPAGTKMDYNQFRDHLKKNRFYNIKPELYEKEAVRNAIADKNRALFLEWRKDHEVNTKFGMAQIQKAQLPKNLPQNLDKQAFIKTLGIDKNFYGIPDHVYDLPEVKATAWARTDQLFALYEASSDQPTPENVLDQQALNDHQKFVNTVDQFGRAALQKPTEFTTYEDFEKAFFLAHPDQKALFLDPKTYKELLQKQWNIIDNLNAKSDLEKARQEESETALELENLSPEDTENPDKYEPIPDQYNVNWRRFGQRLSPQEQMKGMDRFMRIHNRPETGLQNLMQHFHQPLAGFILEALAVIPQDKFDILMQKMKETSVRSGSQEDAQNWLHVFCENIGMSYLAKETPEAFTEMKQNYQTRFSSSFENDAKSRTEEAEAEDEIVDIAPENEEADLEALEDEIVPEILDEDADDLEAPADELDPEIDEPILDEDSEALEIPESETPDLKTPVEEMADEELDKVEGEILTPETDHNIIEPNLTEFDHEAQELQTDEQIEDVDIMEDAEVEADSILEDDEIETLLEEELAEGEDIQDQDREAMSEILNDEMEAEEALTDDTESADITDEAPVADLETIDEDLADQALEAQDNETETVDQEPELIDEVEETLKAQEEAAQAVEKAEQRRKEIIAQAFDKFLEENWQQQAAERNSTLTRMQVAENMRFQEEIEAPQETATQLKESETSERPVMTDPIAQIRLQTHMRQFYAMNEEQMHFYTNLFVEMHFQGDYQQIGKLLQKTKSYAQFALNLGIKLNIDPSIFHQEITGDSAREIFNAIVSELHKTRAKKGILITAKPGVITLNIGSQKSQYTFKAETLEA